MTNSRSIEGWKKKLPWRPPTTSHRSFVANAFSSDKFPIDETFLENFGPKDRETEEEARVRNWVERGWAPWEEILSPEADFARKSLNEGEEVPLQNPEVIEAFKMLRPNYRKKKMEEMGLTEDDYYKKQFQRVPGVSRPAEGGTEWLYAVLGSIGAAIFGSFNPLLAYVISLIVIAYYREHNHLQREVDKWCLIIACMGTVTAVANFLQHFYFGIMGEKMTERVCRMMFSEFCHSFLHFSLY